ncbi:hypothetical protein D3C75_1105830 [compost metagenome]
MGIDELALTFVIFNPKHRLAVDPGLQRLVQFGTQHLHILRNHAAQQLQIIDMAVGSSAIVLAQIKNGPQLLRNGHLLIQGIPFP